MSDDPLIIALPSKGRIQEGAFAFFEAAGLKVQQGADARDYSGARLKGLPGAELRLLSASEIAASLEAGTVHLGITGEDLLRESSQAFEETLVLLKALGFGRADVVVAVPKSWIDVRNMADLDDVCLAFRMRHGRHLRVATKYLALTRQFFAAHGVSDYRIVESLGATEGAPASGTAELIVDITSTGTTLAANNLKILDDGLILRSEAHLAASLRAPWGEGPRTALTRLLELVAARDRADRARKIRFYLCDPAPDLLNTLVQSFGCTVPWPPEPATAQGEMTVIAPESTLYDVVSRIREQGCGTLTVDRPDYIFEPENPVLAAFLARIDAG